MADGGADQIDAGVERNLVGAEVAAAEAGGKFDHIELAVGYDDVALHDAVVDAEASRSLLHQIANSLLGVWWQVAGQLTTVFDDVRRIALQQLVVTVDKA